MQAAALDPYRLITALKGTGKNANFTAEEIASAIDISQQGSGVLTASAFDAAMAGIDAKFARLEARMSALEARMDAFETKLDAKLEALRADIKAEVKSSQVQNLLWLSGIVLASNGMVIALLARLAGAI
jgi:uncharacterized protein YhaN